MNPDIIIELHNLVFKLFEQVFGCNVCVYMYIGILI